MENQTQTQPIFIIGSGRSGTSAITGALKSCAGLDGYLEGHFFPLLHHLMTVIERFYYSKRQLMDDNRHMIAEINREELEERLLEIFRSMGEAMHQGNVWLDKSPDSAMIQTAPYLLKIWPRSRFIFAKRRGIENIISRLKKFPNVSFERHCIEWANCMGAWLEVKDKIEGNSIQVEQREMALQPNATAKKIGDFLELTEEVVEKLAHTFATKRPQSTGGKEEPEAIDIKDTGWSEEEIAIFRKYCSEVSQKFGYSESSSYYLSKE